MPDSRFSLWAPVSQPWGVAEDPGQEAAPLIWLGDPFHPPRRPGPTSPEGLAPYDFARTGWPRLVWGLLGGVGGVDVGVGRAEVS